MVCSATLSGAYQLAVNVRFRLFVILNLFQNLLVLMTYILCDPEINSGCQLLDSLLVCGCVSREVQDIGELYPIDTVLKFLTLEIQADFNKSLSSCPYYKQIQAF